MRKGFRLFIGMIAAIPAFAAFVTTTASGLLPADVTPARDSFRSILGGGVVAGANGLFQDATGARREINWDGVPDTLSAPNNLPASFFNSNSPRGVVFATPGSGFQVSANAGVAPVRFGNIDPSYSSTFQAFSQQRLFTALGSNITDVNFFVPGTSTPAFVTGFGSVFTDVDTATSTSIQLFDLNNNFLGSFAVPSSPSGGLSFLGISGNAGEKIGRVRITSGNAALGSGVIDASTNDLVVMDDFLYSNPTAVPEPGTLLTALPLLIGIGLIERRRRMATFLRRLS